MTDSKMMLDLANRFAAALEAVDLDVLRDCYAPDAVIWLNTTNRELPAADVVAMLPHLAKRISNRRYTDRRVSVTDGGFIQQHRLTGLRRDGAQVSILSCIVCNVRNGKIARLEEYCDSLQLRSYMA